MPASGAVVECRARDLDLARDPIVYPRIRSSRLSPDGGVGPHSGLAGSMVTLSPQPQASVSFGLWKTNLAESLFTS